MALSSAPVQAGTWKFSCTDASTNAGGSSSTYSNSDNFMGNPESYTSTKPWTPPADATGTSYQIPSFGFDTSGGTAAADTIRKEDVSITAKITMTWMPDTSLPSDPAPTSLWLIESSSAQWVAYYGGAGGPPTTGSGSAADGIGDAPVASYTSGGLKSGEVSSSGNAATNTTPPAHWFQQPVNGGVATLTRTFHASASASLPQNDRSGSMTLGCSFGGYQLKIHAQPYNFYQTSVTDNGSGTLTFKYAWLSTDGNLSDLDPSCLVHEYVTYQGGSHYTPPAPFTVTAPNGGPATLANPTISPTPKLPGSTGVLTDNQLFGGTSPLNAAPPYYEQTFIGTQTYDFDDSATGQVNQPIPGADAGPLSITRKIGVRSQYLPNWWYSVTKNGTTAWAPLGN